MVAIDVIGVTSKKLINEGSEVYEEIVHLKFEADDGKKYATDQGNCMKFN